jgi:ATP-binding cassette subfamily F protein 3
MEQLVTELSPIDHLRRLGGPTLRVAVEEEQRSFLGSFGFSKDRVFQPVGPFSGGEKARLILALLISQQPNLLLLDEPTNHLDLEMRHALGMALQEYTGALILVSHDRYLLRLVADQLWLVADGTVSPFDGDLDEYALWLKSVRSENSGTGSGVTAKRDDPRERKRIEAERRQRLSPLKAQIATYEKKLNLLTSEIALIASQLADPALYEASQRASLAALVAREGSLRRELTEVEDAWLEASERLARFSEGV